MGEYYKYIDHGPLGFSVVPIEVDQAIGDLYSYVASEDTERVELDANNTWVFPRSGMTPIEDVYQVPAELIECSDGKKRTAEEYAEWLDRIASITKDAATS